MATPTTEPTDLFYLWHLEHIGLLNRTANGWESPLWDKAKANVADPVKVALIDSGIDSAHPNIAAAVQTPQADFAVRLEGAIYEPPGEGVKALKETLSTPSPDSSDVVDNLVAALDDAAAQSDWVGLDLTTLQSIVATAQADPTKAVEEAGKFLDALAGGRSDVKHGSFGVPIDKVTGEAKIDSLNLDVNHAALAKEVLGTFADVGPEVIRLEDPSGFFGAHGTACAGLIGGRPATPNGPSHPFFSAMPYYGVNPYCQIIPITTPYSHEIRPVINALLLAYLMDADVIHIPRGMPYYAARQMIAASPSRTTRLEVDGEALVDEDQASISRLQADSALFEALLEKISEQRFVVLAAGNDGTPDKVSYPAAGFLSPAEGSPTDTKITVVGAQNRSGHFSAYTNGENLINKVLFLVSDDGFALDRDRVSVDQTTYEGTDFDFRPHADGKPNTFSPWAPLSLDVRGSYGYAASHNVNPPEYEDGIDRGSLYTLFGGTSASSSIGAGLIALLIQAGELTAGSPVSLADLKQKLTDNGITHFA